MAAGNSLELACGEGDNELVNSIRESNGVLDGPNDRTSQFLSGKSKELQHNK
jgi:hypothetical protein